MAEHEQLQFVGAVQRLRFELALERDGFLLARDTDEFTAGIMRGQVARRSSTCVPAFRVERCSGTETSMPCRKFPTEGTKIGVRLRLA